MLSSPSSLVFEPLRATHDRASFRCGEPALDDWFHKRARQDDKRNVARVFVALDGVKIVGFYSLSAASIALESLPDDVRRKLPRYGAIPAALIGRLARAESERGKGVGALLLGDAITRILVADGALAVYAIVVEAKDERAARFYRSFEFTLFPENPRRLFLLTSTARAALRDI